MFEIKSEGQGKIILAGRLDASKVDQASRFLESVQSPAVLDLGRLEYISSMGLGLLIETQKRLKEATGGGLKLVNVGPHIHDIFQFSGFHHIFEIEAAEK